MTVAALAYDLVEFAPNNAPTDNTYLNQGNNPTLYPTKILQVISALNGLFPNVPVSTFVYRRQDDPTKFKNFPYGRAIVSINQRFNMILLVSKTFSLSLALMNNYSGPV
jgi:hypothetical protein